jgi:hypothetical protein
MPSVFWSLALRKPAENPFLPKQRICDQPMTRRHSFGMPARIKRSVLNRMAGGPGLDWGSPLSASRAGSGGSLDMMPPSLGAFGCGAVGQTKRLNLPGVVQGGESFRSLYAHTNRGANDPEAGRDAKLAHALYEAAVLFPLASGATVIAEEPQLRTFELVQLDASVVPRDRENGYEHANLLQEALLNAALSGICIWLVIIDELSWVGSRLIQLCIEGMSSSIRTATSSPFAHVHRWIVPPKLCLLNTP